MHEPAENAPRGKRAVNPIAERAIGRLLYRVRAGDRHLVSNAPRLREAPLGIRLTSAAFADGGPMPQRHGGIGVGDNLSPPLEWSVPEGAAELVLVMEDPDAPLPRPVVHVAAIGIPPSWPGIGEGLLAPGASPEIRLARGSFGRVGYAGPRPVRGHGPHRYIFEIFALAERLDLGEAPALSAVVAAMSRSILARGLLTGIFERS
jgi:Raf kinase inhibitor-like YbhB/YbcL family protein